MTTAPSNAKQPQDRKKPAAQVEVEGDETIDIEFEGKTYTLPASPDGWSVRAVRAGEAGQTMTSAALVLEGAGYNPDEWSTRKLGELFSLYSEQAGFGNEGE